jgi:hypothetical protein
MSKNKPITNYEILQDLSVIYKHARDGREINSDVDTMLKATAGMLRLRMYEFNKRAAAFAGMFQDNGSPKMIARDQEE